MFKKSGLCILVLTVFQVSARHKNVEPHLNDNKINSELAKVSSSSRIVSGWEALPGQHPHHAALELMHTFGWVLCGGSIISKEWIVTAAPCAFGRVLAIVRVGSVSLVDKNPENIFETTEWYTHPNYNGLSGVALQSHGVTLVKLQRPLVYSNLIKRIRIQSSADAYRDYGGLQVYASGHGRTSSTGDNTIELRWVYLRALSNTACRNAYTSGVFDTTICARYFNVTSQSTCNDDLGGPLVHVDSDGIPTLIGISYFFPGGTCESGQPSGFYRPGVFLPWFQEVTGIDFENLQEDDENYSTEDDTTTADNPTTSTTPATTTASTSTTTSTTLTTPTTMTTPGITTTITTPITTTTTPTASTNPSTITTPTTTTIHTTTASEDQDLEELTTEDNTTLPPEDTEEEEEEEEEEEKPDSPQVLKHRKVNVNVKVLTNIRQM